MAEAGPPPRRRPVPVADGRTAALQVLLAVETGAEPRLALDAALGAVADGRERALATELAYGVMRWRGALDAELQALCRWPLADLHPPVRAALRLGLYQLRHLDRVPAYAAVATAVALARRLGPPGAPALVNAVLRRAAAGAAERAVASDTAATLAARYSHPRWLVARWVGRLGPQETEALLAANNQPPRVVLRVNRLRCEPETLRRQLAAAGIRAEPARWAPEGLYLPRGVAPGHLVALQRGLCTVQGEASMLVAHVADPRPGTRCLEAAAAPGGKATHLAEWMADRGLVLANERDAGRAELIAAHASRLGLRSLRVQVGDARDLPAAWSGAFDVVVADLPCSGLGTLAARADARWRKRPGDLVHLPVLQLQLLQAVARCLRPGGRLVYSTCSTETEENEQVVAALCARVPYLRGEDMRPRLPPGLRGATSPDGAMLQLWPHRHGTEGFFIASLRRTEGREDGDGGRGA